MKLWKKLTVLFLLFLISSLAVCGTITLYHTRKINIDRTVSNYKRQLEAVSYTFDQFGARQEFEEMSETVRNAYLQFEFKKCCGAGYALLKDGGTVINLTDYDIVNPDELDENGMVQSVEKKKILILKKVLQEIEGYEIVSIQDITDTYRETERQLGLYLLIYWAVSAAAAVCVAMMVKRLLKPLKELEQAAGQLSGGNLKERVEVRSSDEVGELGAAFNRMASEIEHQVDDLKLLLGALNHEIKTPMTSIIGYSESLIHVKLPEEQRRTALNYIYQEGKRLESLSGKMMSLLGLYEEGAYEFTWIPAEALFQCVEEMEKTCAKAHGVTLKTECRGKWNYLVDPVLMESLIGNLVQNGIRASEPGDTVIMRDTEDGMEVQDFGRGIPESEIANITKAFYMVDKSRSRKEGGAGLGLAICGQIAKLHHARLEIRSREGEGTVVRIHFEDDYKTFTGR